MPQIRSCAICDAGDSRCTVQGSLEGWDGGGKILLWNEAFPDGINHLKEPVEVERVEGKVAAEVDNGEPKRYRV